MSTTHRTTAPFRAFAALLLGLAPVACTGRGPAVVGPAPNAEQTARTLEARTGLRGATRIVFRWELNESGVRMHGKGVARIEEPYRARLDLFLSNGETAVRAALVGQDLRLPPGAPRNILPPPELMWGVLGVFRPERETRLLGADRLEGGATRLRYQYPNGDEIYYRVEDGHVTTLERLDDGHTTQRVQLSLSPGSRFPATATYRDLTAFRELKLTRESVDSVQAYPPDIWDLVR